MKTILGFLHRLYTLLFMVPFAWLWTILVAVMITVLTWLGAGQWADRYLARIWGRLLLWITPVKVVINNQSVLQPNQSYVIIANHQSTYDILVLYGYMPVTFKWVMKIELRKVPFVGYTCELMGHIYVDRKNRQAARKTMEKAGEKLVDGTSVIFFPEGTRSRGDQLLPFKKGAFKMAQSLSLPLLPVSIKGADKVMPSKSHTIKPGTIEITFHEPFSAQQVNEYDLKELIHISQQKIADGIK